MAPVTTSPTPPLASAIATQTEAAMSQRMSLRSNSAQTATMTITGMEKLMRMGNKTLNCAAENQTRPSDATAASIGETWRRR